MGLIENVIIITGIVLVSFFISSLVILKILVIKKQQKLKGFTGKRYQIPTVKTVQLSKFELTES